MNIDHTSYFSFFLFYLTHFCLRLFMDKASFYRHFLLLILQTSRCHVTSSFFVTVCHLWQTKAARKIRETWKERKKKRERGGGEEKCWWWWWDERRCRSRRCRTAGSETRESRNCAKTFGQLMQAITFLVFLLLKTFILF